MTKAQIKSKMKKAINALDKAQHAMDELRRACEDRYDEVWEYDMRRSKQEHCQLLSSIIELCGFDIEDTTIELQDYLDEMETN